MAEHADRTIIASEALARGRRHLVVKDFTSASDELSQACEILTDMYGATADECGECYLLYAKALLGCAREEAKVLDITEPANGDASPDSENDTDVTGIKNGHSSEDKTCNKIDESKVADNVEESDKPGCSSGESKLSEAIDKKLVVESDKKDCEASSSADKSEEPTEDDQAEDDENEAGGDGDADSVASEDVSSLQLAWEVLELACQIFTRQGAAAQGLLAEVFSELGEVSLESGNFEIAIKDFSRGLELLESLELPKPRQIAEAHFKIGLSQTLLNLFAESVVEFNKAIAIIDNLIENETTKENDGGDKALIEELKQTKEDIFSKIADVQESKEQAIEAVLEQLRRDVTPTGAIAGPSTNGSNLAPELKKDNKPAADISHLVKRKRKPEENDDSADVSTAKRPTP